MPRIILVHGAAHGAWCWERIVPRLTNLGFAVDALDLPGLGADTTPLGDVSFDSYRQRVLAALRSRPGPAMVVGHSMGGGPISAATEAEPALVSKLVYLAATLPIDGEGLGMAMRQSAEFPGPSATAAIRPSAVPDAMEFDPALAADAFYNECDAETARAAVARLRPQATRPMQGEPITLTPPRYGAVTKTYIVCTRDQALPPALQRWLCARVPAMKVIEKPWDHSPFFSDPDGLAALLAAEANSN